MRAEGARKEVEYLVREGLQILVLVQNSNCHNYPMARLRVVRLAPRETIRQARQAPGQPRLMVGGGVELTGLLCLSKLCTMGYGVVYSYDDSDDLTYRIEGLLSFDSNNNTITQCPMPS